MENLEGVLRSKQFRVNQRVAGQRAELSDKPSYLFNPDQRIVGSLNDTKRRRCGGHALSVNPRNGGAVLKNMGHSITGLLDNTSGNKAVHSILLPNAVTIGQVDNGIHRQHALNRRVDALETGPDVR